MEYFILNVDRYCPKINKVSHKNKCIPWNTCDLKKAYRKKQLLYKKYKISKSENDFFIYKMYKNNIKYLFRETKKKYYSLCRRTLIYVGPISWNKLDNIF